MEISTFKEADCFVVTFPERITLESMKRWGVDFKNKLNGKTGLSLLLDTNSHNFESVECLKWLRVFLTQEQVLTQAINKVAFVQPENYRVSEVISDSEAYFNDLDSARKWLNLY
jgi:hypothetical protein